jgi:hypothetical protein
MPERDWQRDWELCENKIEAVWAFYRLRRDPYDDRKPWAELSDFFAFAREALPYWLQRVRELEEDVRVISAANRDLATAIQQLKEENARLRGLLEDIVRSPTTFEDERLDYVELQVDLETLKEARKLLG